MLWAMLRSGGFGQQCGLNVQGSKSSLLAGFYVYLDKCVQPNAAACLINKERKEHTDLVNQAGSGSERAP
jgi:hypothetical protein